MKYFTADTHFGNAGVSRCMRRLDALGALMETPEHHDPFIINQINKTVGEDDTLYILGDLSDNCAAYYLKKLTVKDIVLIAGNHDDTTGDPFMRNRWEDTRTVTVSDHKGGKFFSMQTILSHYPHMFWDGSHRGYFHLYGHVHGMREDTLDSIYPQRRSMDVGLDNAFKVLGEYRPFSEQEIWDILSVRHGHDKVSFYREYQQRLYSDDD